ncbi:hypothetical protein LOD99_9733 [Oopsacas minuta]|uniref:Protein KASH5 n=1 Tax=Oopsacas minuta TaxID=111878 RepID=A0AAV7KM81_9METZ|nr:hypothetical protein LOD99_9733 [Oopsacas minuta]
MAERITSSLEETIHEGLGSGSEELDHNYSSSSFYLLGIVNQSQNASFGVEEAMFRPDSPHFREVLDQVYQKCLDMDNQEGREGPTVWQVVDTVRGFMFQTDEGGVGNESEVLLNSLSVELELQKSPGDFLTRESFNIAMESWIHSVSQQNRNFGGAGSSSSGDKSDLYSNPMGHTHSLTGSYSLEGTGGVSSERESEHMSERVEQLMIYSEQLETENTLLKEQLLENEETISELTDMKNRLEKHLTDLRTALHNNQSITLENSALKQELSKLDSSLSQIKQKLFQETKHRQTLESELEQCNRIQGNTNSVVNGETYLMESYGEIVQQDPANGMEEIQDKLDIATSELSHLCEENEHLHQRILFLTDKNEDLCQQIGDLEQELGQKSLTTPTSKHNSSPPIYHTPSLEQELTGAVYTSPIRTERRFYSSTPLNSLHLARESIFDKSNSSLELLESLSNNPKWKELCSIKSINCDVITQKTGEIMSDLNELDCGIEYSKLLDKFRAKHLQLQSELEESLKLRGESEKEVTQLQDEVNKLREQINKLQQQLQDLSHVKSHGDTLIAEISTKDGVIKQLSGELDELSQKLTLNDSEGTENAKLITSIHTKTNQIQQLITDKQNLQNKLTEITNQLQIQMKELQRIEAENIDIKNQLIETRELLKVKTDEAQTAVQSHQQILAEINTQQDDTARLTEQLQLTSNQLELFQQEHYACLKDLWHMTQGSPMDPSFRPTYQQVKNAITQRIQSPNIANFNTSQSLPCSPTRLSNSAQNNSTLSSLTPTGYSTEKNLMLTPTKYLSNHDVKSLEERVRAILIWYSSARYTTKPTCQAWKQHVTGLEGKISNQLIELDQALVNKNYKQAGKLLKRLKNSISVLTYSSCRVGRLEQECWDLDNYGILQEYIDILKRTPRDNSTQSLSLVDNSIHRNTPYRNEEEIFIETHKNLFPDFSEEFNELKKREIALQFKADELSKTLKTIKPANNGVTFRGILVNFHLSLSFFFLLVLVYLLMGPFPESLPIIRHKLVFGPVFSFSKYFIDTSEFTPII